MKFLEILFFNNAIAIAISKATRILCYSLGHFSFTSSTQSAYKMFFLNFHPSSDYLNNEKNRRNNANDSNTEIFFSNSIDWMSIKSSIDWLHMLCSDALKLKWDSLPGVVQDSFIFDERNSTSKTANSQHQSLHIKSTIYKFTHNTLQPWRWNCNQIIFLANVKCIESWYEIGTI